ncbi:transposase [Exiguobacterium sp. TNDT2]|uniref:transposase n=1 Tax=Exiguobacterium sp. TNDT2 TaxID=2233531 RepID=UPI00351A2A93
MSIRSIARRLGRQLSTVSRKIKRNPDYESGRAQRRYEKAKTRCGATKLDDTMRRTIIEKLRATWSPEQIVDRTNVGFTISERPLEVKGRQTLGHWELDTVVSGRGKSKACVRDVPRAQELVLSRPADRGPHRGLNGGGVPMYFADPYSSWQRAAEKAPRLEKCTRGLHRGSVALNLTNRHMQSLDLHKLIRSTKHGQTPIGGRLESSYA